jgi:hypothetical protein
MRNPQQDLYPQCDGFRHNVVPNTGPDTIAYYHTLLARMSRSSLRLANGTMEHVLDVDDAKLVGDRALRFSYVAPREWRDVLVPNVLVNVVVECPCGFM